MRPRRRSRILRTVSWLAPKAMTLPASRRRLHAETGMLDVQSHELLLDVVGRAIPRLPKHRRRHRRRRHEDPSCKLAQRARPAPDLPRQQVPESVQEQDDIDEKLHHANVGHDEEAKQAVDDAKKEFHRARIGQAVMPSPGNLAGQADRRAVLAGGRSRWVAGQGTGTGVRGRRGHWRPRGRWREH